MGNRLKELEDTEAQPTTPAHAQQLYTKLKDFDSNFKEFYLLIIDQVDGDEALEAEQVVLDEHDDDVASLTVRLQRLMNSDSTTPTVTHDRERRSLSLKISRLERGLKATDEAVSAPTEDTEDLSLVQHQEQLSDYKKDLAVLYDNIVALDPKEDDELLTQHSKLEGLLFDCSRKVKKLIDRRPEATTPAVDGSGVKLPKLDVPVFDGNILHWKQFWDQFCVSVHERSNLTNAEKLVYLQHALKDGSAKSTIEGLSQSGEHYVEAIECLKSRYHRPCLIHQTHVRLILEAPPLKEGTGKELRRLHDIVTQHLRALKSMEYDPSGPFITSVLELKLDTTTLFEWQKQSVQGGSTTLPGVIDVH